MSMRAVRHVMVHVDAGASDSELVERVLRGDRDAYGSLVRRHQQLVHRHAAGMGLDHDTCADVVQDAFVRAYTRLDDCREPAHFRAWLLRIARNLCLDHLKNARTATRPLSVMPELENRAATAPDLDCRRDIGEALAALPPALREAFLLKHDAGYTYDEIGEITNATPSAVKMRVHRAREALRSYLE